jgi:hypothetical protein
MIARFLGLSSIILCPVASSFPQPVHTLPISLAMCPAGSCTNLAARISRLFLDASPSEDSDYIP